MLIKEKDFQGFVKGQEKAFDVLFRQYYRTLVSFAMRYGVEQMEAEDIVIEVIHRIWEVRKKIESPIALNTLFYTSVRNRTLNVVRNLRNRQRIIESRTDGDEEEEFYDHLMEEEISYVLDEAITALPPQCRQVILLLLSGKSVAEIAEEMHISAPTVRTYKLRAIDMLRTSLAHYPLLLWIILMRLM